MHSLVSRELAGDLALTIAGGVVTGLILEMFRPRRNGGGALQQSQSGGEGFLSGLLRLVLAVGGGVLIAYFLARPLIQAGIAPRGAATRLGLVVGGATVIWMLLFALRRR